MTHEITIEQEQPHAQVKDLWYLWVCSCGNKGKPHPKRGTAEEFGKIHQHEHRPYVGDMKIEEKL